VDESWRADASVRLLSILAPRGRTLTSRERRVDPSEARMSAERLSQFDDRRLIARRSFFADAHFV
jgi:hypothetical protein